MIVKPHIVSIFNSGGAWVWKCQGDIESVALFLSRRKTFALSIWESDTWSFSEGNHSLPWYKRTYILTRAQSHAQATARGIKVLIGWLAGWHAECGGVCHLLMQIAGINDMISAGHSEVRTVRCAFQPPTGMCTISRRYEHLVMAYPITAMGVWHLQ